MANPFAQFAQPQGEQNPFAQFAQPKEEPNPFAQFAPKPEEEGFITGLGKSIYGGVRDTGGSLYAAGATAVGANQAVVESAQAAAARSPEQAKALQAYQADIQKRKQAGDEGLWAGIKNVAGATVDNPEGALQMVVSQLPNTAVALGAGAAGAGTGAAIGSVVPGVGTAIGGTVGFLVGLFGANTALELGSKAQEKAQDGKFTDAERYEAMKEGVVKGATITAVDAATFGASKWVMGAANRAVETATVRTIQGAGIDATKATTSIKEAQAKALEAAAGQSKEATTAAVEKATVEAMAREGLTDPALVASIRQAQAKALEGVNTVAKKAGRGAAGMGLETVGEGLGEYLGEYAATGKASPTEAVMEALAGLSMSVAELHGATRLDKPGALTGGTNAIYSQYSRALDDQLKAEETKVTEQLTAQLGRPPTEEELNAKLNQLYGKGAGTGGGEAGASVPTPSGGAPAGDTAGTRAPIGGELGTDTGVAGGAGVGAGTQPSALAPGITLLPIPYDTVAFTGVGQPKARSSGQNNIVDYAGRKIVLVDVNGVQVPFYLSTGSGGKVDVPAGKWYPFFGIGADGWINKTGGKEMAGYYGSEVLQNTAAILDSTIGDIRNDSSIPKVGRTGTHIDAINTGFTPSENGDSATAVRSNIANLLNQIKGTPKDKTGPLDPKQKRIEELTQELIDAGLTPQNARQNAEEQVNNEVQADEEYRQDNVINLEERTKQRIAGLEKDTSDRAQHAIFVEALQNQLRVLTDLYNKGIATDKDIADFDAAMYGSDRDPMVAVAKISKLLAPLKQADKAAEQQKIETPAANEEAPLSIAEQRSQLKAKQDAAKTKLVGLEEQLKDWQNLKPSELDALREKVYAADDEFEAARDALIEGNRNLDDLEDKQIADSTNLQAIENEEKIIARIQDDGNRIDIRDYADGLQSGYEYYAATTREGTFRNDSLTNIRRVTNLADAQAAIDAGMSVFELEQKSAARIQKQIDSLVVGANALLSKNGSLPRTDTAKRLKYDQLQKQITALKEQLPDEGAPSVLPAREDPLPQLAGMHPETATAIQENDITNALKAMARNTSGFFADLAKRLAELKLQTGISFDNERNLVRRAIDLKTTQQQKRLFTYIRVTYPTYYDKYFKNYDREENLEKVFEGLRAVSKLNLGPVTSEYSDVVEQYEKNMPALTSPGAYFPQFNEITLNTKTRTGTGNRVMLHEVVHAATVAMLAEDTTKLTPEQREAVLALSDMYQYAKKVLPPGDYGMTNIYEFVSEVFTNKKFQDRLRAIPYKVKGQKGGFLTAFIQKILDLFGMNNLASSAMVQAEKLFSAEVPSTTVPSGPKFAKGKRTPKIKGPISTQDKWRTAEGVNSKGVPNARTYMDVINDILHRRMPWEEGRKELSSTLWSAEGGNVRKATLGFLNLRQIADLTSTKFPQLTGAIKTIEQMLAYRGTKLKRAESTTVKWIAAQRRDPQMSSLMSRIMLEATIRGIDPDTFVGPSTHSELQKSWELLDTDFKEIYREVRDFYADSVKDMVDMLKERAKAHGTPTEIAERLKQINDQFGPDKLLKPYFPLRRFGEHYFQVGEGDYKEFYTFESRSTRDLTMKKRRKELMAGNPQQQKAAGLITPGTGTSNILTSMSTTKVVKDAQKLIDGLGNSIEDNLKKNPGAIPTQDAEKYIAELKGEMKDALNQLLYITLPQVSMRKMFINRRSIQGASEDMLRVFATTAVHSAYQQSRLKYSEDFFSNLVNAKSHVTRSFSPERQAIYDDYIKEVAERAKTILSTEDTSTTAKVAGKLSESTFYFMLSAPFTAMLNIIGATTIAMPYIGARYGYAKSNALMLKNLGKYTATAPTRTFAPIAAGKFLEVQFPSIVEGGKLSKLLQRAADRFVADGDITISLTNDINNLSERPSGLYTGNYENVKKVLSGLFHQSERLNREVVLMTTFELAYEKFKNADQKDLQGVITRDKTTGQPIKYTEEEAFEAAIAESREIAGQTLGDFSRQMKPRYFTSPLMGVLTKFKQYAVLATYVVMRNLYLSIGAPFSKSELKELRAQLEVDLKNDQDKEAVIEQRMKEIEAQRQELYKEARRRLAGILGVTFLYGGMEAMPFFSLLGPIVAMFAGGDDDEDPDLFEWHSWFRNYMQETFGGAAGAILARGLGTAVTSGALSERVSLDLKDLWYRDGRYSPDVRQGILETAIANSGPVVGLGMNWVDAYGLAKEGQLDRAFEKLLPAIASKPLAATRIATEEGRTRRGIELAGDFSAWEIAMQATGLQPERFAIAQKKAIDAKLHEQKVDTEKNALLNRLWMERDTDEFDNILDDVAVFNTRHPVLAITGKTVQDSFKTRAKNQAIAENLGVQLSNPKMIAEVESKLQYKPYSVFGKNE